MTVDWRLADDDAALDLDLDLPFGVTARLDPPTTEGSTVTVDGAPWASGAELAPGHHAVHVTGPRIAG